MPTGIVGLARRKIPLVGYPRYDTPFLRVTRGERVYRICRGGLGHVIDLAASTYNVFHRSVVSCAETTHVDFIKPILYHDIIPGPRLRQRYGERLQESIFRELRSKRAGLRYSSASSGSATSSSRSGLRANRFSTRTMSPPRKPARSRRRYAAARSLSSWNRFSLGARCTCGAPNLRSVRLP